MNTEIPLQIVSDYVQIIEAIVSTLAVIIGGYFAWRKWFKEGPEEERALVSQDIESCLLSKDDRLVHVVFTIENKGTSRLVFKEGYSQIHQVIPLNKGCKNLLKINESERPLDSTGTEYKWPIIAKRNYPTREINPCTGKEEDIFTIESNETERYHCDFIIPAKTEAIFIYSNACLKPKDLNIGWDVTTFHRFSKVDN
jgi:hypothetical protein